MTKPWHKRTARDTWLWKVLRMPMRARLEEMRERRWDRAHRPYFRALGRFAEKDQDRFVDFIMGGAA
jgi:hypothetical protein